MQLASPKNNNYCATIVELSTFVDLPNCDNVKAALIFGNSVIISKSTQAGEIGVFFPVEVQLHQEFLSENNLYRKAEWGNNDLTSKGGFFEQHGRVKAVKFRGHKSEGFYIPIECLNYIGERGWLKAGDTFDAIGEHEICRKYIPKRQGNEPRLQKRGPKLVDQIVDGQFKFHEDTENLRRNIWKLTPDMTISISDKWHGTSAVIGNLLVKRELNWFERLLNRLGVKIEDTTYGLTYSSRKVIKAVNGHTKVSNHYYSEDIWGVVAKEIGDRIPKGYTLYGEIVGYTPDGSPIQNGYHYGCHAGKHRFLVYRVTSTNVDGQLVELSWPQRKEFCTHYGLEMVKELWYGVAGDLFALDCSTTDVREWQEDFLQALEDTFVDDHMCVHNFNEVPAEGIVIAIDSLTETQAYKLKSFKFLERESKQLDKGEVDIETVESEEPVDNQPKL